MRNYQGFSAHSPDPGGAFQYQAYWEQWWQCCRRFWCMHRSCLGAYQTALWVSHAVFTHTDYCRNENINKQYKLIHQIWTNLTRRLWSYFTFYKWACSLRSNLPTYTSCVPAIPRWMPWGPVLQHTTVSELPHTLQTSPGKWWRGVLLPLESSIWCVPGRLHTPA
jgi:hypothetical protein